MRRVKVASYKFKDWAVTETRGNSGDAGAEGGARELDCSSA